MNGTGPQAALLAHQGGHPDGANEHHGHSSSSSGSSGGASGDSGATAAAAAEQQQSDVRAAQRDQQGGGGGGASRRQEERERRQQQLQALLGPLAGAKGQCSVERYEELHLITRLRMALQVRGGWEGGAGRVRLWHRGAVHQRLGVALRVRAGGTQVGSGSRPNPKADQIVRHLSLPAR